VDLQLPPPDNEFQTTFQSFSVELLHWQMASRAFLASLERQQGAECVLKGGIGSEQDRAAASDLELLQREALEHNMRANAALVGNLLELGPQLNERWQVFRRETVGPWINEAWQQYSGSNLCDATPLIRDIHQARDIQREAREELSQIGEEFRLAEFGITDYSVAERAIEHPTIMKEPPEILISNELLESLRQVQHLEITEESGGPEGTLQQAPNMLFEASTSGRYSNEGMRSLPPWPWWRWLV
jgi:hypothetical protein